VRRNVAATGAVVFKVSAPSRPLRRLRLQFIHSSLQIVLITANLQNVLRHLSDATLEPMQASTQLKAKVVEPLLKAVYTSFDSFEPHEYLLPHGASVVQAPFDLVFERGQACVYRIETGKDLSYAVLRKILSRFFTHARIILPAGRAFKVFRGRKRGALYSGACLNQHTFR
jgi:hypothetical protein